VAAGSALLAPGRLATEDDNVPGDTPHPRVSEQVALQFAERGVLVSAMRLPPSVHGRGDHGFVPALIGIARAKGLAAYVGDGSNRWAAVHRLDAARLFRLALESAPAGTRLHAVGDEGVPFRDIAAVIGRHLDLPVTSISREEADSHFGGFALFASMDVPASSAITQQRFGWHPVRPGLIADLDEGHYFS
jgi:nucleoside-diphosphate-sugar epimerase